MIVAFVNSTCAVCALCTLYLRFSCGFFLFSSSAFFFVIAITKRDPYTLKFDQSMSATHTHSQRLCAKVWSLSRCYRQYRSRTHSLHFAIGPNGGTANPKRNQWKNTKRTTKTKTKQIAMRKAETMAFMIFWATRYTYIWHWIVLLTSNCHAATETNGTLKVNTTQSAQQTLTHAHTDRHRYNGKREKNEDMRKTKNTNCRITDRTASRIECTIAHMCDRCMETDAISLN